MAFLPRAAAAQEVRFTRPVVVQAAAPEGTWVRVPLGPDVLRHAGAGGGLRLYGPEGEDVPFRRIADPAAGALRRAELGRARAARGGWWLPLEVPAGAGAHERLLVALGDGTAPPAGAVRLAASDDGESWRLLVAGELRPAAPGDARLALPYPATEARHLRLGWPRPRGEAAARAEPPELAAAVQEVPPRSYRVSLPRLDCRAREPSAASARLACRLPLGGAGRFLRRLCFTTLSEAAAGYRLFLAEEGRWESVAEGVWAGTAAETPRCLALDLTLADAEDTLLLELYGGAAEPPVIRDATAELRGESLLFRARRPGRHTLAYGPGVVRGSRFDRLPAPPGVEPVTVQPGPEEAAEVPAAALDLPAAAGPAPAVAFDETWSVAAEDPEPGGLHRLVLPAEVYGAAGGELAELRLLVPDLGSEVQAPYLRWRPEEPVLAGERRGAEPEVREGAPARVTLEAPAARLPLSALVVSAPAGDGGEARGRWSRRVRAVYLGGVPGADEAGAAAPEAADGGGARPASPWLEWSCAAEPPLPCRFTIALADDAADAAPRRIAVEIDDRGAEALPAVDLELWRRRDVLLFAWPAGGVLLLGAGASGLEAPEYELEARRLELLARPWREARLVGVEEAAAAGGRLGAWALGLALVAAAAALVVLLHRMLGERAR